MIRMLLAAVAAIALVASTPALACPDCGCCPGNKQQGAAGEKAAAKPGCENCPMHKAAAAEAAAKHDCENCPMHKAAAAEKKDEPKAEKKAK